MESLTSLSHPIAAKYIMLQCREVKEKRVLSR